METVTVKCIITNSAYMISGHTYKGYIRSSGDTKVFVFPESGMDYIIGRHVIIVPNIVIPLIGV